MALPELRTFIISNFMTFSIYLFFLSTYFLYFVEKKMDLRKRIGLILVSSVIVSVFGSLLTVIGDNGFMTKSSALHTDILTFAVVIPVFLYLNRGFSLRGLAGYFVLDNVMGYFVSITTFFVYKLTDEFDLHFPVPQILAYQLFLPIFCYLFLRLLKKVDLLPLIRKIFLSKKGTIYSTLAFISIALFDSVVSFFAPEFDEKYPFAFATLFLTILIGVMIFSSFYNNTQQRIMAQNTSLLQQENYVQTLETLQKEMRTLQHDYKNILSGLYLQSTEGNIVEIQTYLQQMLGQIDESVATKLKQTTHLSNIKVLEIKSLILTKLLRLEQTNIPFNLEIADSIDSVNMDTPDFVRCLGILLDNAIEEIQQLTLQDSKLDLVLSNESEDLTIIVKNPTKEQPNVHKIWQEGFSTKGENRGLGLASYQNILKKYPQASKRTIVKENSFIQILTIRNG